MNAGAGRGSKWVCECVDVRGHGLDAAWGRVQVGFMRLKQACDVLTENGTEGTARVLSIKIKKKKKET